MGDVDTSAFGDYEDAAARPRREKVSEALARQIVQDIVLRNLEPGDALESEGEMLHHYRVGRASLREALRILEVHGLLSIRPGPGGGPSVSKVESADFGRMTTFFFQMNRATYAELVEARLVIEPVVARLAAQVHDADQIERLRHLMKSSLDIAVDDHVAWVRAANAFHGHVATMAGNRVLTLFAGGLRETYRSRVIHSPFAPQQSREAVLDTHQEIAAAIADGEPATAERLMREHMQTVVEFVEATYPGILREIIDW